MDELPNMHINDISQDEDSFIWISTDYGLSRFNGTDYLSYYHLKSDPASLPSNKVLCSTCDSQGILWVLTKSGVCALDPITNTFENVLEYTGIKGMISAGESIICYSDNVFIRISDRDRSMSMIQSQDKILLARNMSENRIAVAYSSERGSSVSVSDIGMTPVFSFVLPDSSTVLSMADDYKGMLWIGTDGGLRLFDLRDYSFVELPEMAFFDKLSVTVLIPSGDDMYICAKGADIHLWKRKEHELSHNLAKRRAFKLNYTSDFSCGLSDGEGLVWVGTYDRGYAFRSEQDVAFVDNSAVLRITAGKYINSVTVSPDGIFWLASMYKGILAINEKDRTSIWYNYNEVSLPLNSIEFLYCDSRNRLWMSSGNEVSVSEVDGLSMKPVSSFSVPGRINAFCEDEEKNVWAATSNGVVLLGLKGAEKTLLSGRQVSDIVLADGNMLAAVSNTGIMRMENGDFKEVMFSNSSFQKISDIAVAPDGRLWIGSSEDGLFYVDGDGFKQFSISDGLLCNEIQSISFDKKGNAWVGTSMGLSLILNDSDKAVTYTKNSTLSVAQFTPRSAASNGNTICVAGVSGLAMFSSPRIISRISTQPVKLYLSSIRSNGVALTNLKPDGVAELNDRQKIVLPHRYRSIVVDYEAVEFLQPEKITYAYRLSGLETEWNHVANSKSANYSNLSPGRYTFELIARNPDGYWNETPRTLQIVVRPSPFLAWYSIAIYFILAVLALWGVSRFYVNRKLQAKRLEITLAELENEKRVTGMKEDFFTNISHELRTALSLIYGPINMLETSDEEKRHKTISFINQNTRQLIVLIDQLLNLSRIDNGNLPLLVSQADANSQLQRIVSAFSALAEKKGVPLKLESHIPENEHVFIDTDKVQKMLSNLISNAIKYNKAGGHIIVEASVEDAIMRVSVIDDGVGMSKEDAGIIFERYRRLHSVEKSSVGSGIGLHLVKQLALLHKGDVTATVRDTGGMIFTISLPVSVEAYSSDEICKDTPEIIDGFLDVESTNEISLDCGLDGDDTRPLVAVIEDNPQLRDYLKSILSSYYRVIVASGAEEGLVLLESEMPDIVTTDVMMEGMDGYEFCRRIKDNPLLSHIPVVMLTAKVTDEDKIAAFKNKANAYITKPFNPELLFTVLRNLLEERGKLRRMLLAPETSPAQESIMSQHDAEFISKLNGIIDEKIGEPAVSVNELCDRLCIGRSSLFRKMRALTGVSPNEYIIVYKLNKSVELLKDGSMNISEIGYYLGFSSPSHFTKSFKDHFGKTPREYLL